MRKIRFYVLLTVFIIVLLQINAYAVENNLDEYTNIHPRVIMDEADFDRARILANGRLKDIWSALETELSTYVVDGPTQYYVDSNIEETWMRTVGDAIMKLSLGYKISGKQEYKDAAALFFNAAKSYPSWGRGKFENCSLAASHMLVGISCYYDWLYHDLSITQRQEIETLLIARGSIMNNGGWWERKYLSNLYWTPASSLAVTAAAIYDIYSEAESWFNTSNNWFSKTFSFINTEGTYQEGPSYWSYGLTHLIYYVKTAKQFCNIDYATHPFLQNTADYGIYTRLPQMGKNEHIIGVFNFGDSTQNNNLSWVSNMSYLADISQNPVVQWYVEYGIDNSTAGHRNEMWQLFLYYQPDSDSLAPWESDKYPNNKFFEQLGFVFLRNVWFNQESVIAFRCGPTMGTIAREAFINKGFDETYNLGLTHSHPDINSFMLFAYKDLQIVDDGYAKGYTRWHNTLTVNDDGQYDLYNKDVIAASKANPHIIKFDEQEDYVYVAADGTEAYREETGVDKYVRHFIYVKPDVLLIFDEAKTDTENDLKIRFYPAVQTANKQQDGSFTFYNDNSVLNINVLAEDAEVKAQLEDNNKFAVSAYKYSDSISVPTALSWAESEDKLKNISVKYDGDGIYHFLITGSNEDSDTIVTLDSSSMIVQYAKVNNDVIISSYIDKANQTLCFVGKGESGVGVPVKVTDSTGNILFLSMYVPDENGMFASRIRLDDFHEGMYNLYAYDRKNDEVCLVVVCNEIIEDEIAFSGYIDTQENGALKGTVNIGNYTGEDLGLKVYAALYSSDGQLCDMRVIDVSVKNDGYKTVNLPEINNGKISKARVFCWKSNLEPVAEDFELNKQIGDKNYE
ncbi:MAG: DUF4962 domain-containing protein [Ruminococcaceae bacterium]|nr:DUF4962 domain-containing protein [Oscillospiraceae bacterium]